MSTAKEKLKALRVLMGIETEAPAPEGEKPKFAELTLEDGTILMVEGEMVAGVPVMVKTETGTEAAKPGEYKLSDGSTIVVDQEGKLIEVKAAEVMAVENPEVAALQERVAALEAANTANVAATKAATEQMKKTEEASKQLLSLMEEFIATPQTNTVKPTVTVETPEDKFAAKFRAIKKLSNV